MRNSEGELYNKFTSKVNQNFYDRNQFAYKIIKILSSKECHTAKLNCIEKEEWIKHHKTLWYIPSEEYQSERT